MSYIQLVGLDLDGTLLDDDRRLRSRTANALRLAAESGMHVAVISGRNYLAVPDEIRALPFIRYYVLCNGAAIYDAQDRRMIFCAEIPLDDTICIFRALKEENAYYDCYISDGAWTEQRCYDQIDAFVPVASHRAFLKASRKPFPDLCAALLQRGKPIWKVQAIYKSTEIRDRERERLQAAFPQYSLCTAYTYNLEFNMPQANKGDGLIQLARMLSLKPSQVMAFGDGGNDITMLQKAGMGIAMGNAAPEAKAAAMYVGPANVDDGVAKVLEALVAEPDRLKVLLHTAKPDETNHKGKEI